MLSVAVNRNGILCQCNYWFSEALWVSGLLFFKILFQLPFDKLYIYATVIVNQFYLCDVYRTSITLINNILSMCIKKDGKQRHLYSTSNSNGIFVQNASGILNFTQVSPYPLTQHILYAGTITLSNMIEFS